MPAFRIFGLPALGGKKFQRNIVLHCHDDVGGFLPLILSETSLVGTQTERDLGPHRAVARIYRLWAQRTA